MQGQLRDTFYPRILLNYQRNLAHRPRTSEFLDPSETVVHLRPQQELQLDAAHPWLFVLLRHLEAQLAVVPLPLPLVPPPSEHSHVALLALLALQLIEQLPGQHGNVTEHYEPDLGDSFLANQRKTSMGTASPLLLPGPKKKKFF